VRRLRKLSETQKLVLLAIAEVGGVAARTAIIAGQRARPGGKYRTPVRHWPGPAVRNLVDHGFLEFVTRDGTSPWEFQRYRLTDSGWDAVGEEARIPSVK
jgi:hypothetical protein